MKALILKSNQGNHAGFNRTWDIITQCDSNGIHLELSKLLDKIGDRYSLTEDETEELFNINGFEYDLTYYTPITQDEYDGGIFDGGHYGYAPSEVVAYFEETN